MNVNAPSWPYHCRGICVFVLAVGQTVLATASATAAECPALARAAEHKAASFFPRQLHKVQGVGRLYFHSAPDTRCRDKEVFVIPRDELVVYAEYGEWYQVMYLNTKTGDDYSGWVKRERLKYVGNLGPTP